MEKRVAIIGVIVEKGGDVESSSLEAKIGVKAFKELYMTVID